MEDAATAEIARSQVWQWLHNEVTLESGEAITRKLVEHIATEEYDKVVAERGDPDGHFAKARELFAQVALADEYLDFLTVAAYATID
jgi:malate synthase